MILAGDIGGTKTNLGLYKLKGSLLEPLKQQQFKSAQFHSLIDVIKEFIDLDTWKIDAACFGVAGPVIDGECITTNLAWKISTSELISFLDTTHIRLLNDLEATSYGMLYLREDEFISLNPEAKPLQKTRAVIAAGTGLGEAILFYDGKEYHPLGSEGGHCDFAPLTQQQNKLLQWMYLRYPKHVSYERILSGDGLYAVYQFLLEDGFAPEPEAMKRIAATQDKNAMVSECALEKYDPLCMEALRLFVEIYGAEAGNLALKSLSLGGIYIGGGIGVKILPLMQTDIFMKSFVKKGRFENLLRSIDVKLSLNQETALLGAVHFAKDKLIPLL